MKSQSSGIAAKERRRPPASKVAGKPVAVRSASAVLTELLAFARKHGVRMGGRKPTRAERHGR